MPNLLLTRPYFDEEEIEEIREVLDFGAKYAVPVTNCTAALHLSLLGIGISKGDGVLVADFNTSCNRAFRAILQRETRIY